MPGTVKVVHTNDKKRALGRGLSALIPQAGNGGGGGKSAEVSRGGVLRIPVEEIKRDGDQPRRQFDEVRLKELADSIRTQGLIQPILVRRDGRQYRIIAGERRWRAAQLAVLKEVPV